MSGPSPDILQTASQATPRCGAFFGMEKRYLILAEEKSADPHYGKTARGVLRYSPHPTVAILDSTRAGETRDGIPVVGTVDDALCFNPTTALVGVATQGGRFPPAWRELIRSCVAKGLDVENGLHEFLSDDPELADLAARHGSELRDLRKPPAGLNVPTGENLELDAQVVLTVGSDCAIGKMTVSLELDREARERGLRSVFVPTGQTGIAIAGWGISVDAVVSDFLAGAAERLVVEGGKRGDLLWVERQGAILHPIYSGVTVGLMHGSAPHLYVLCHEVGRTLTGAASGTTFGVADDAGKYAEDGGAGFFTMLTQLGMTENRIAVFWDPSQPDTIVDQAFLDRAVPQAQRRGIDVMFAIYPLKARALVDTPNGVQLFAQFAAKVAEREPYVRKMIWLNEGNQPRLHQQQFDEAGHGIC